MIKFKSWYEVIEPDKTQYIVVIPFNRCDNHKPKAWRYKKTLARKEWWVKRAKILEEYTLKSLLNQTDKDFSVWAMFLKPDLKNAKPVLEVLDRYNVHVVLGENNETLLEGCNNIIPNFHGTTRRGLVMIHLDSDDMYAKTTISSIKKKRPSAGLAMIFTKGYIYGALDGRLGIFEAPKATPPFLAMAFTQASLESYKEWLNYRSIWDLDVYHHQVKSKCKNVAVMAGGQFCYVVHNENVVTAWDNKHTYTKIKRFVEDENEKKKILECFGIGESDEGMVVSDKPVQQPQMSDAHGCNEQDCKRKYSDSSCNCSDRSNEPL